MYKSCCYMCINTWFTPWRLSQKSHDPINLAYHISKPMRVISLPISLWRFKIVENNFYFFFLTSKKWQNIKEYFLHIKHLDIFFLFFLEYLHIPFPRETLFFFFPGLVTNLVWILLWWKRNHKVLINFFASFSCNLNIGRFINN